MANLGAVVERKYRFALANLATPLIALLILAFISFQIIGSFNLLCPPSSVFGAYPRLYQLLYNCGASLWPFMSYGMYSKPNYEGDQINQYYVYAILRDSSEVRILPEDLGIDSNLFRWFVNALIENDTEYIETYVNIYESRHNADLIGFRLDNHPLILARDGVYPGPPEILAEFDLSSRR